MPQVLPYSLCKRYATPRSRPHTEARTAQGCGRWQRCQVVPLHDTTGGAAAAGASSGGGGRQPWLSKHACEEGCSSMVRRASPDQVPVALRRHRGVARRGRCAARRHVRTRHRTTSDAFRALSCLRDSRSSMEGDERCPQAPNIGTVRRARGGLSENRWSDVASQSQRCDSALLCLPPALYTTLHSH
jgi:hypothetical protein